MAVVAEIAFVNVDGDGLAQLLLARRNPVPILVLVPFALFGFMPPHLFELGQRARGTVGEDGANDAFVAAAGTVVRVQVLHNETGGFGRVRARSPVVFEQADEVGEPGVPSGPAVGVADAAVEGPADHVPEVVGLGPEGGDGCEIVVDGFVAGGGEVVVVVGSAAGAAGGGGGGGEGECGVDGGGDGADGSVELAEVFEGEVGCLEFLGAAGSDGEGWVDG